MIGADLEGMVHWAVELVVALVFFAWLVMPTRRAGKAQWLAISGGLVLFGLWATVWEFAGTDQPSLFLAISGPLFVIGGGLLTASVFRQFARYRRLPEHLRDRANRFDDPQTLTLESGRRILAIDVVRGGYVAPRLTDPPFDARDVVEVAVATHDDREIEAARRPRLDKTHRALYVVSSVGAWATVFGFVLAVVMENTFVWIAWSLSAATLIGCIVRFAVLRRRESPV